MKRVRGSVLRRRPRANTPSRFDSGCRRAAETTRMRERQRRDTVPTANTNTHSYLNKLTIDRTEQQGEPYIPQRGKLEDERAAKARSRPQGQVRDTRTTLWFSHAWTWLRGLEARLRQQLECQHISTHFNTCMVQRYKKGGREWSPDVLIKIIYIYIALKSNRTKVRISKRSHTPGY